MQRFDQGRLLDGLAERGELGVSVMPRLARVLADFHRLAEVRRGFGDLAATEALIEEIQASFAEGAAVFDSGRVEHLMCALRTEARRRGDYLNVRDADGFVRHCHGDLHLRNIVLDDGMPVLFDAIEFNEALACNDVLYDLAFVLMDLEQRGLRAHANTLLNGYFHHTGDYQGLPGLPLYLSLRAAIRAHVSATMAVGHAGGAKAPKLRARARRYLELAGGFLLPEPPRMVAVGGLSGSGKSTLARGIAPPFGRPPGAIVLRSDQVRKELMSVEEFEPLPPEAYAPEISSRVYRRLLERAGAALQGGQSVVVDAVFARLEDRQAVEEAADRAGAAFRGFWLRVPPPVLERRVAARGEDASDATVGVVREQLARETGAIAWTQLDASVSSDALRATAGALLGKL
jgi:predicted kinase